VGGGQLAVTTETGLVIWRKGHISQQPWSTDLVKPFSLAFCQGKFWIGDAKGSIYEFDGNRFNEIATCPPTNAGKIRGIINCPIGDGLIIRSSGIFQKISAMLVPWKTDRGRGIHEA
jgi:outer membrane protein assembly factor BamB